MELSINSQILIRCLIISLLQEHKPEIVLTDEILKELD